MIVQSFAAFCAKCRVQTMWIEEVDNERKLRHWECTCCHRCIDAPPPRHQPLGTEKYLSLYVVYNSPADYPAKFVVREFRIFAHGGSAVPQEAIVFDNYADAENYLLDLPRQLYRTDRQEEDDTCILEVWI